MRKWIHDPKRKEIRYCWWKIYDNPKTSVYWSFKVFYPYNNREDGDDDSNLYFQLIWISIINAYILQIGPADYDIFNKLLISAGFIAIKPGIN